MLSYGGIPKNHRQSSNSSPPPPSFRRPNFRLRASTFRRRYSVEIPPPIFCRASAADLLPPSFHLPPPIFCRDSDADLLSSFRCTFFLRCQSSNSSITCVVGQIERASSSWFWIVEHSYYIQKEDTFEESTSNCHHSFLFHLKTSTPDRPEPEFEKRIALLFFGDRLSLSLQLRSSKEQKHHNMGKDAEEQLSLNKDSKDDEVEEYSLQLPVPKSPINSRPNSMVVKKANTVIPAHLVAEAISTLHGLDLRWSGPITPSEMQYVQQYVLAKYPEYCNGLVEGGDKIDLDALCINDESSANEKGKSPRRDAASLPSFGSSNSELGKIQLEPSRLLDILTKKTSFQGNFISIPEIQVRNRALQQCGLSEEDYLVVFALTLKEAMMMIGECYPFFRGNYYMTILGEQYDCIREFVTFKDSKIIAAPETWLDLRIKGSQLSQYFRRKSKHSPKGLFAYPAYVQETRYSMHWISEAHRNSWHVLLDASSALDAGKERLALSLHRPDFVLCTVDNTHAQPSKLTCLLVRKQSFETAASSAN